MVTRSIEVNQGYNRKNQLIALVDKDNRHNSSTHNTRLFWL